MSETIEKTRRAIETGEGVAQIPYFVHEREMWRLESINKRLVWATVTAAALTVVSNVLWALHIL